MKYQFDSTLEQRDAIQLRESLEAALRAMAHFQSDFEHITTITEILASAYVAEADAFRAYERQRSEQS